tara:strand:+ start:98045 stop:99583 length:1539 start_codon:yes stop_codon:yes gene_type:complete
LIKYFSPIIRGFLRLILSRTSKRFEQALTRPLESQEKTLKKILTLYNSSSYGIEKGKASDYQEFIQNAPLINYESIEEKIESMRVSKENYFSPGPVIFYEPTSGSSGNKKLIPYTWALKSSFSKMFSLWARDLLVNGPKFKYGKLYFSVSPQFKDDNEGLEDDAEYLEGFFSWFLKSFFTTPKKIKRLKDPHGFKKVLALHLLAQKNLEIISVWNPSTFAVLLEFIDSNRKELLIDLEKGFIRQEGITFKFAKPSPKRVAIIKEKPFSEIWPKLKLVSSWGSKEAELGFNKLKKIFPNAFIQAKGLLATEAPITIPLIKAKGFVPLIDSIFYEFENKNGEILRLHEIVGGEVYKLIISTPGGLYRYSIGDRVSVPRFYKETPCLEFEGRGPETSDLFGEKINLSFLNNIVKNLKSDQYYLFIPNRIDENHGYYTLLTNNEDKSLSSAVEKELMKGFHYKVARNLGTLKPLEVICKKDMNERVLNYLQSEKGMKLGDIKPSLLLKEFDLKYLN